MPNTPAGKTTTPKGVRGVGPRERTAAEVARISLKLIYKGRWHAFLARGYSRS
jgi:hypothetical protein